MHDAGRRLVPAAAGALALAAVLVAPPAAAVTPTALGGGAVTAADADDVEIDILGINDFHGRLEANRASAGAAVLAGAVADYRATNANTLFVSAGDNIGASTFTSFVQDDVPTIDALNAMGLDVSALGNHEFDQGRADIDDRVLGLADFPYLAANLYEAGTQTPAFDEYWTTDVDGVTVGFIGAVTEDLPTLVTPAGIETLDVGEIVPAVNRVATDLSDGEAANGEADVIVLLVHEGPVGADPADATDDSAFGMIAGGVSAEVDAIFGGHTHQAHAYTLPVDGWPDDVERPIVGSGQYGENLAHVKLWVDPTTGDVTENEAHVVPLTADDEPLFDADPTVAQIVEDAVAVAEVEGAVSLGAITADILRAVQSDGDENRGGESTLGNLVADVQLWATQDLGTDLAFMNPGGLREDLEYASSGEGDPDGNVTYREAATVQPFANTLVTMTLTGEQVIGVLEEQWQPADASRPFLKLGVAGLTYTYDPTAPEGSRVTGVWLEDDTPLDLDGEYTVVVNSFLASGGDNFATLAEGEDPADSGRIDLQAFVDYFEEMSPVVPELEQRAIGVHVDLGADGIVQPGETVDVHFSSLLFSTATDQADQVEVTYGEESLGTFDVDPAIVDATDEVGRAMATLTVPEGAAAGWWELQVRLVGTDTSAMFVVPVSAFADVSPGHPFFEHISWLADSGITTGYPDGTFRSTWPVTREAMAAFLYRLENEGGTAPDCTEAPFPDVSTEHPFCGEISWLDGTGITTGFPDGTFRPGANVTREAMAAFLYRTVTRLADAPACTEAPFADVPTGHPFCGHIAWLADNGISTGWPDGTFRPGNHVERQAMAAFLHRAEMFAAES